MEPLTREQALDFLGSQPVAHLGLIIDGEPVVFPMSYVVDEDRILFRTMAGSKLDGIRANPRVCVEVSSFDEETGDWQSAIATGTASLVDSDEVRQGLIASLFSKYEKVMGSPMSAGGGLMPLGGDPYVIEVTIDELSGMSSHGGFRIRTKPGRL